MAIKHMVVFFATIILAQCANVLESGNITTTNVSTSGSPETSTFSTAGAPKRPTETPSTASTSLNPTKWRSSSTIINTVVPTSATESPINEAVVLYNQLKNAVERSLLQTRTSLEQLFRSSITFTSNGIRNIFKISSQFFKQLEELSRKYMKIGVDISNCLKLVEPGFSKLPLVLANELSKCITPEFDVVSNYFLNTVRNVTYMWDVVVELGIKLNDCGTNNLCITDLISQMTEEFFEIPTTISTDLLKLQEYLETTTTYMGTCAESKFSTATANGTQAIKIVSDCAREANV